MFNLTHNEDSAVDIGGVWVGPDEFELHFKLNQDDNDLEIFLVLTHDELKSLVGYLDQKLVVNRLRNM
jgi:sialic acid synthase SpsE